MARADARVADQQKQLDEQGIVGVCLSEKDRNSERDSAGDRLARDTRGFSVAIKSDLYIHGKRHEMRHDKRPLYTHT